MLYLQRNEGTLDIVRIQCLQRLTQSHIMTVSHAEIVKREAEY